MTTKNRTFHLYEGIVYFLMILDDYQAGVIELNKLENPSVTDVIFINKKEWSEKSRKVKNKILKRLIVQVPK